MRSEGSYGNENKKTDVTVIVMNMFRYLPLGLLSRFHRLRATRCGLPKARGAFRVRCGLEWTIFLC